MPPNEWPTIAEAHLIHRRARAIARQVERDRFVAGGTEARDLRLPQPRRSHDPLQEDDWN
jgi:hypothetical protein